MRFTLRHLFLLFLSCFLALSLANVLSRIQRRSTPHHAFVTAIQQTRLARGFFRIYLSDLPTPPDESSVNLWLAGQLPATDPLAWKFYPDPPLEPDPWGHPLVYVTLPPNLRGDDGSATGVYSLGEDGVSKTAGNDPDDLNSWDLQCGSYYREWIAAERAEEVRAALMAWGIVLTPAVCVLLYGLGIVWSFVTKRPDAREGVPRSDDALELSK